MHCGRGGREYAFIPASLLVDTSEENAHLQLLSHNQENNVNEKKLATLKGTKIDHKAEAERHEQFCAEAIKYNQGTLLAYVLLYIIIIKSIDPAKADSSYFSF